MKLDTETRERWSPEAGWREINYWAYRPSGRPFPPVTAFKDGDYVTHSVFEPPQLELDEKKSVDVEGSRKTWKRFEHYKMLQSSSRNGGAVHCGQMYNVDINDYTGGAQAHYPNVTYGVRLGAGPIGSYYAPWGLPSWRESDPSDEGFVPLPAGLEILQQKALEVIMPKIKSEFSVLNALYELKDFKGLVLSAKRCLSLVKKLGIVPAARRTLKQLQNSLAAKQLSSKEKSKRLVQSAASTASGSYLTWKFAIAPLISDIMATWAVVSNTEKQLRKLLDNAEKVRLGHFSLTWQEYQDMSDSQGPWLLERPSPYGGVPAAYRGMGLVREVKYEPSKFHVEIEYSYALLNVQVAHSRLFAYLDAFGINLNPAIIWNAIPYTFILDWVVGVSRFLDGMKAGFMDPVVFIHQYLWSVSRERRITGRVRYPIYGSPSATGQEYGLPVCVETAYRRETKMPSKSSFLTTSGLSPVELSLGAALLVSRKSRKRYTRLRVRS